jgi:hypothetical protein
MSGKLFLVPTPIGNLEDITLRALRVLREVDLILAEDTRTSSKLLKHYEIVTPLRAYHLNNEHAVLASIVALMDAGQQLAVITDAGSPGISDPGFLLVRECWRTGIAVEALPGATALIPAITESGFPCDRFVFEGFLPPKKGRQKRLQALLEEKRTVILYESPHRLLKLLEELVQYVGETERLIAVAHELTKIYAFMKRGTPQELFAYFSENQPKGEFVVLIAPCD